ncbi:MAG: CTP synthase [Rikenellaceae bacterium]|nr:CTP synthase [Rikenellaceae bacterium]
MKLSKPKYIFVTGGVASSLGKGIISATVARLLQARGYSVTVQKFDPYINAEPGRLNPYEHGESYVTEDGTECDLDLGHYERFTSITTTMNNTVTTGKIYREILEKERRGDYMGKTVQVIPHITDEIKRRIQLLGATKKYDVIISEIGGTVGDIESLPYIESVRQLRNQLGYQNSLLIHLAWVPYMAAAHEMKTKPTQHSVKELQSEGVQPDVLVLRAEHSLAEDVRRKVALFCNVTEDAVVESIDVPTIYEVPLRMRDQHLDDVILRKLGISDAEEPNLKSWSEFVDKIKNPKYNVEVALVGKYTELPDAYKSINESFIHAGAVNHCKVKVHYIPAEQVTDENAAELLGGVSGIFVAPGSGVRGFEGKVAAVRYARENNVPFFGVGLGMQASIIEFARDVLGMQDAQSRELDPQTKSPIIDLMEEQKKATEKGSTMRLGGYTCALKAGSKAAKAYGSESVVERHRHRYEFNNVFLAQFEAAGMEATGVNPETGLVEVLELKQHPWFVAVQYNPEYKSTVSTPAPLFVAFVAAAMEYQSNNKAAEKAEK